ncbi:hypothetical protein [Frigoriglobus tundricola]|uniref:Uncharacterized protein n=1 Tax=Frigoriglobus tundricola TaxID=2774151 RepID=A0A6M5YIY6_9BACT|nr:hypothetical protein [Frigoriglobus tundricola]QJW93514.1 hypothetical protein FTUN_1021 [Frigoriglobus tundricola]
MHDSPARRKTRPGRWRWAKRLVAAVVLGLVCACAWVLVAHERVRLDGEHELTEARAEVTDADPDWTWEKLNAARKKPPAGLNGADLVPEIKAATEPEWGQAFARDEFASRLDPLPNVQFAPDVLAQARRDLKGSADAVRLARQLKHRPTGHREIELAPNVVGTLLVDTQNTRLVADLLRWDVTLAIEDGDIRRASDSLLALLNASRSIGDEPLFVSQLVRMAVRSVAVRYTELALAQSPSVPLIELQAALAADAEEPLLLYGTRGERAALDRLFDNLQTGVVPLEEVLGPRPKNLWGWQDHAHLPMDRATALRRMTACVEAARRPLHEQAPALAAIPEPPADPHLVISGATLSTVENVAQAFWRTSAQARCAVVGIACERFRQQHRRWPGALTALVPAFLPAVPLDPYTGEPLQFAKLESGAVVYSVGSDRRGDGGTLDSVSNTAPRFRLWNPDQRRRPAPPAPAPEREPPP